MDALNGRGAELQGELQGLAGFLVNPDSVRVAFGVSSAIEETFGAPACLIGFALPGCNAHAPDEWIDLGVYRQGIAALADFYGRLGNGAG